jgi:hypothetical protein
LSPDLVDHLVVQPDFFRLRDVPFEFAAAMVDIEDLRVGRERDANRVEGEDEGIWPRSDPAVAPRFLKASKL